MCVHAVGGGVLYIINIFCSFFFTLTHKTTLIQNSTHTVNSIIYFKADNSIFYLIVPSYKDTGTVYVYTYGVNINPIHSLRIKYILCIYEPKIQLNTCM